MSKNKKIKSVGFNVTNKKDQMILNAIKRRNFSAYVKKLLWEDLTANNKIKDDREEIKPVKNETKKQDAKEELQALKERKKRRTTSNAPSGIFKPNQ